MDIYEPAEDSFLLQNAVKKYAHSNVLDMGTGSGIQALTAVEQGCSVSAVDINPQVVQHLRAQARQQKKSKRSITVFQSDLFSRVKGMFDTIIFNPPYLPQDEGIDDVSLYGGEKGWEISARFFSQVSSFLNPQGVILFLFSSLTNKPQIEKIIRQHLFQWEEVGRQKIAFEELYVYKIQKSTVLQELERNDVADITYTTHGCHGDIYRGIFNKGRKKTSVAIKIIRSSSGVKHALDSEVHWLKRVNEVGIGPQLLFSSREYVVMEFVNGPLIIPWLETATSFQIIRVLRALLKQCFVLDQLGITKEEMHHPLKHVFIQGGKLVLIDFERCSGSAKPKNVTQCVEFYSRIAPFLERRRVQLNVPLLRQFAGEYKHDKTEKTFKKILAAI